ncbi:MAG: hypothetical protein WC364_04850 [Eubacteriales bacterium]|jgi:hypothetical protein
MKITVVNDSNDGPTIEFCCGENEYFLKHGEKVSIEVADEDTIYLDVVYGEDSAEGQDSADD